MWIPYFHHDPRLVTTFIRGGCGRPKCFVWCDFGVSGSRWLSDGTERDVCTSVVQLIVAMAVPASQLQDVLAALQAVTRPALLDRQCASASVWCNPENACALMYVEEWLDAAQFVIEVRGERIGRLLGLVESATRPPTLEVRSIGNVRGLDYLAAIRVGRHDEETAVSSPIREPVMRHDAKE